MADESLPTSEEIAGLPRWARLAFAARCARRALPLFTKHWPYAPEKHVIAVGRAVIVAEAAARATYDAAASDYDDADAAYAADYTARAAATAAYATAHAASAYPAAAAAAYAASIAAAAAAASVGAAPPPTDEDAGRHAHAAGVPIVLIRRDLNVLLELARHERWTNDTPVPPSVFGPLEEAQSSREAERPELQSQLVLRAYLGPSADPDAVGEKLVELYEALNDLSIEKYGRGLTVKEFEQLVPTLVPAPTGGG